MRCAGFACTAKRALASRRGAGGTVSGSRGGLESIGRSRLIISSGQRGHCGQQRLTAGRCRPRSFTHLCGALRGAGIRRAGGSPSDYGRGMEPRSLGRTGMQVSPLCLGAMMFGAWGEPDHDTSIKIIHRALDAGINFVDTADVYSQGESEIIVGKALAGGRRDIVLATKFHGKMGDDPNRQGNSRRWIMKAVEDSLRRLDTDYI